jgi:class 3 adenylate cyclase
MKFLEDFCEAFQSRLNRNILRILETPPETTGLTFGIDRGTLVKIIMNQRKEYVGRAINVACRLQGAIKDKDPAPQYKILMTNHLYNSLKCDLSDHRCDNAKRTLRNIAGDKVVRCKKIFLRMSQSRRRIR